LGGEEEIKVELISLEAMGASSARKVKVVVTKRSELAVWQTARLLI
jgi:hypothetical protein